MSIEDTERLTREALRRLRDAEGVLKDLLHETRHPRQRGLLAGKLHGVQRRLSSSFPWFSQHGQDRWIDEVVFGGRRAGVFLDIGAYDGLIGSNSFFFEALRGWTGLLVEASPGLAQKARSQRSQPVAACAAGASDGLATFLQVDRGYTQMGGILDAMDASTVSRIRSHPRHAERLIEVPVRPVASLLAEYELASVDLVFIDVEGAEHDVLAGFPFARCSPSAFCIENNHRDDSLLTPMAEAGYLRVAFVGVDEVFVRQDHARDLGLTSPR